MTQKRWTILLDGEAAPDRRLIGGKAWSVARMRGMGLPVPPAFVITTEACLAFLEKGDLPEGLEAEVEEGLRWLEAAAGRSFGAAEKPLLLSVRSGAAVSMPGMMDTVLNLGADEEAEAALARESGDPVFARDTHRRFLELYAAIVLKTPVELDPAADPQIWRAAVEAGGRPLPASPRAALTGAIRAVFESWNARRARRYREHNGIPHDLGTAVTVQAMVFGNLDDRSGTGVLFSRNPLDGARAPYGEYLPRAQGEDVVSGKFTPLPLEVLREREPEAHAALLAAAEKLEAEHRDMQDIEFTVQNGALYLLQARTGKRAPDAAARLAVDMVQEGLISVEEALSRVTPEQIRALLLPRLATGAEASARIAARGEGACPGVATGVVVADSDEAERRAAAGEAVVLMRKTTSPEDIHGMIAARAIVTEQGGSTSHAAVVGRALGRPCAVGVGGAHEVKPGDLVTVDGAAGVVYAGELAVEVPEESADPRLERLIGWARERSPVRILRPAEAEGVEEGLNADPLASAQEGRIPPESLEGIKVARGLILADPENARLARDRGVKIIVTEPVLPALLALLGDPA